MGILSGNPKDEPLHYGEIYGIWQYSTAAKGFISSAQLYLNHAGDKDLKNIIKDMINNAEIEYKECDQILTDNGIGTSPSLPSRPQVALEDIPVGARYTDPEIVAMCAAANSGGMVACSQVMGTAIREDIASNFGKYHTTKASLGLQLLRLSKEKGWIVPPPLQVKRPEFAQV